MEKSIHKVKRTYHYLNMSRISSAQVFKLSGTAHHKAEGEDHGKCRVRAMAADGGKGEE
jgi:hypothetical protein